LAHKVEQVLLFYTERQGPVEPAQAIAITGAYIRPGYRGRRAAVALRDYQARGFTFCAMNFESFNPEAAAFRMKYFEPVCLSVVRVPEA
jgi:hypothetical protein